MRAVRGRTDGRVQEASRTARTARHGDEGPLGPGRPGPGLELEPELELELDCAAAAGAVRRRPGTGLYEGSPCKLADGSRGQCIPLTKCPSALALFRKDRRNFRPKRCGFRGFVEVICCADVPLRRAEEACRDFTNEINPSINVYIYGGSVAQPGEFPHMVGRPRPAAAAASADFAEPFEDGLNEGPLFRELVHRGPPLARVPPPDAPPPLPLALGADQDDESDAPASTAAPTAADGLAARAGSLDGAGSDEGSGEGSGEDSDSVELSGRAGFLLGGIRDAVKRHRDRVKEHVRHLGEQIFGSPRPEQQQPVHDVRPHHDHRDEPSRPNPSGQDDNPPDRDGRPPYRPDEPHRPYNNPSGQGDSPPDRDGRPPHRPDEPHRPYNNPSGQGDSPPERDGRPPHRPDDSPRPVPTPPPSSTASPARGVPGDDAYGELIDPRTGVAAVRGKSTFGAEFGALEEETTSRPRLIRVTASAPGLGEGKAGRPGNWRVPPDSVWARPPGAAGSGQSGQPLPIAVGAPPGSPGPPGAGVQAGEEEGKAGIALYVIGGDEAMPDEFKHMVALGFRDASGVMTWDCGGTLISNEHVLTAAHCVTNSLR
ncbi:Phenoloxidase-activating factor 1 [Frankliniella fusca]|uniref:Phenoloxidase-activating factor 1 n=1 Tax=Frankliniella fusca TaxID=407009 RepID=A0AAE1LSU4_9NEOP|nr:Phenoloxidase-activating factor 1 [Frankliniella fusca]